MRNMLDKACTIGIFLVLLLFSNSVFAQENSSSVQTEQIWRITILNPSVELELPVTKQTALSTSLGVGYGGSYPDLSFHEENGLAYLISPFVDVQYKWFYNLSKRMEKGRSILGNSGNFISARVLARGTTISSNFDRTSNLDAAFGPTWGIQRLYGHLHLLFDVGPVYYTDFKGNGNIFPIMLQLNLGFDL